MKKLFVCFLALALAASFTLTAQEEETEDEGIGLSAGVELGTGDVADTLNPYLMPMIVYDNSFLDGALDIYAELDYYLYLDEDLSQEAYFDLFLGYNLDLGESSTLTFSVENENDIIVAPQAEEGMNASDGLLTPAIMFNQTLDFGDLYLQAGFPLSYMSYDKDADFAAGLDVTIGWQSNFGLGLQLISHQALTPESGFTGLDAIISYTADSLYAEVEIDTLDDLSVGVTITPYIEFYVDAFTIYAYCEFDGVGGGDSVSVSPALGVKFSF